MIKHDVNNIYTTKNNIKITVDQTGSTAMIREKGEEKATKRQGFRVRADGKTLKMGDWKETERDCLLETIKYEHYAKLAYKELYFDLLDRLNSIGLIEKSQIDD